MTTARVRKLIPLHVKRLQVDERRKGVQVVHIGYVVAFEGEEGEGFSERFKVGRGEGTYEVVGQVETG